jgi:Uma2 family endonuclease
MKWVKRCFLEPQNWKVFDYPNIVIEVVNPVIGDELTQLYTDQSNLYHSQNAQQWKISPKTLKFYNITTSWMKIF